MLLQLIEGHLKSLDYFINLVAPEIYKTKIKITKETGAENFRGYLIAKNRDSKKSYKVCNVILFSYGPRIRFEIREGDPLPDDLREAVEMLKETGEIFMSILRMGDTFTFN